MFDDMTVSVAVCPPIIGRIDHLQVGLIERLMGDQIISRRLSTPDAQRDVVFGSICALQLMRYIVRPEILLVPRIGQDTGEGILPLSEHSVISQLVCSFQ